MLPFFAKPYQMGTLMYELTPSGTIAMGVKGFFSRDPLNEVLLTYA